MGGALALAAWLRGAEVTAVCGPGCPALPPEIRRLDVLTARDMFAAAADVWPEMDMGCFTAAVADFSPEPFGPEKFKKEGAQDGFSIRFQANPDILATLAARRRPGRRHWGFAAETAPDMEALMSLARAKRAPQGRRPAGGQPHQWRGKRLRQPDQQHGRHGQERARGDLPQQAKADVAWELLSWLLRL